MADAFGATRDPVQLRPLVLAELVPAIPGPRQAAANPAKSVAHSPSPSRFAGPSLSPLAGRELG